MIPTLIMIWVYMVRDFAGIGYDLYKALGVVGRPALVHFPIAAKGGVHQIMGGFNAIELETVWVQGQKDIPAHMFLGVPQKGLDIAHDPIQEISLMQQHPIEIAQLLLLKLLPFAKGMFLQ